MKNIAQNILSVSILILYKLYSYDAHLYFIKLKNVMYSPWLRNVFKKCGNQFYVSAPAFIKGGKYIEVGANFSGLHIIRLGCWDVFAEQKFTPSLTVGDYVSMNNNVHIGCINKISIGNNVLFASNIFITVRFHGNLDQSELNLAPYIRSLHSKGEVTIMDDLWIGENVSIMPNVTIGKSCVIGANSVVTKSFPDFSVIAGSPAKLIRNLNR